MKKILHVCLLVCFMTPAFTQSSELCRLKEVWNTQMGGNSFKESAAAMSLMPNGNLILVGSTHNKLNTGKTTDAFVAAIDANGKTLWSKEVGGTQFDNFVAVDVCLDGCFWVLGQTESSDEDLANTQPVNTHSKLWVAKFSPNGDLLRSVFLPNLTLPAQIKAEVNGGFVLSAQLVNAINEDIFLGKYDGQVQLQWKTIVGGMGKETESSIDVNAKGEVALLFASSSNFGFSNKGGNDLVVMKWNEDGQSLWHRNFGGSNQEKANSIQFTTQNELIITARTFSIDGDIVPKMGNQKTGKGWILKLDSAGKMIWQTYILGNPFMAVNHSDGGFWVLNELSYPLNAALFNNYDSPAAYSMACLQKLNKSGRLEWSSLMGQKDHLSRANTLQYNPSEDAIYVSGNVFPSLVDNKPDYWIGRYSYNAHDIAPKLSVFDDNDEDWSGKTMDISKKSVQLMAKVNARIGEPAAYGWLRDGIIVKGYSDKNQDITFDQKGAYQALITHKGCAMLSDTIVATGKKIAEKVKKDSLLTLATKLNPQHVQIPKTTIEELTAGFQVFPNPAKDRFYILPLSGVQTNVQMQLMRVDGVAISKVENLADDSMTEISLAGLPAGQYLLQINADNQRITTKKILKM